MATKAKPRKPIGIKAKPCKPRLLPVLLWTAVFLLLLIGIDQLLVRVPASYPAHVAVADFYRDLRGRAFGLAMGAKSTAPPVVAPAKAAATQPKTSPPPPATVESIIERNRTKPAAPVSAVPPAKLAVPAAKPAVPVQPVAPAKSAAVTKLVPAPPKPAAKTAQLLEPRPRYVYPDEQGTLHFTDTLAEVPDQFRGKAKPLGE